MTRENKLALVVGFALILFVGILISDHFSVARNQASADLSDGIQDPLAHVQADQPGLIQLLTNTTELPSEQPGARGDRRNPDDDAIYMGTSEPEVIGFDAPNADEMTFTYHQVRAGESLAAISSRYFGDASLARELAAYNGMANPDLVGAGRRLRIPKRPDVLIRGGPTPRAVPPSTPPIAAPSPQPQPEYATYTIKSGDVLSRLSQDLMGTTRRMNELIELNRDVITNPDRLIPGTVIRVPKN